MTTITPTTITNEAAATFLKVLLDQTGDNDLSVTVQNGHYIIRHADKDDKAQLEPWKILLPLFESGVLRNGAVRGVLYNAQSETNLQKRILFIPLNGKQKPDIKPIEHGKGLLIARDAIDKTALAVVAENTLRSGASAAAYTLRQDFSPAVFFLPGAGATPFPLAYPARSLELNIDGAGI